MADVGVNIEGLDHGAGNHRLQVAQAEIVQGIQGVCQTVIEIVMRCDTGQKGIEHRGLPGKLADPVQLHRLEQDAGNHGDTGLPMGEDFTPGIGWHMLINDIHNAAFIEIVRQNRSKSDRFCVDVVDDIFGHRCDFRKIWKSLIILTRKNLGLF